MNLAENITKETENQLNADTSYFVKGYMAAISRLILFIEDEKNKENEIAKRAKGVIDDFFKFLLQS